MGVTEICCALILAVVFAASVFIVAKISAWITARDEAYEKAHEKDKPQKEEDNRFKAYFKALFADMKEKGALWIIKAPVEEFLGYTGKELTFTSKKSHVSLARILAAVIFGALGGGLLAYKFEIGGKLILMMMLFVLLFMIAFIDIDTMEIPPYLNYLILFMGIAAIFVTDDLSLSERFIGLVCVSVPMMIMDAIIPEAFGWGDIKLMLAAGFLIGWKIILAGFIFGIFIGGFIGVIVLIRKKKGGKDHMPFGPSLCLGIAIAVLYGMDIINWYADLLAAPVTK